MQSAPLYMILWGLVLLLQFFLIEILRRLVKHFRLVGRNINLTQQFTVEESARGLTAEALRRAYTSMMLFLAAAALWSARAAPMEQRELLALAAVLSSLLLIYGFFRQRQRRAAEAFTLVFNDTEDSVKKRIILLEELLLMAGYLSLAMASVGPWLLSYSILRQ